MLENRNVFISTQWKIIKAKMYLSELDCGEGGLMKRHTSAVMKIWKLHEKLRKRLDLKHFPTRSLRNNRIIIIWRKNIYFSPCLPSVWILRPRYAHIQSFPWSPLLDLSPNLFLESPTEIERECWTKSTHEGREGITIMLSGLRSLSASFRHQFIHKYGEKMVVSELMANGFLLALTVNAEWTISVTTITTTYDVRHSCNYPIIVSILIINHWPINSCLAVISIRTQARWLTR